MVYFSVQTLKLPSRSSLWTYIQGTDAIYRNYLTSYVWCEEENTCGTPVLSGKMGTLDKVETIGKGIDYLTVIKHEGYYLGYFTASVSLFGGKGSANMVVM
jgi:hypothetical protein